VAQWSTGAYAELVSPWSDTFRTTVGLRGDLHRFDVENDRPENSGRAGDEIVSPKLSLAFGSWGGTELYVSGGLGFPSNDGRGTVTTVDPVSGHPVDPVDPLVRSRGAEAGARSSPVDGLRSSLALWMLELDSELLFLGDAGTTEASDPSRRVGVTFANFYRITDEWSADLDVSFTRARFLHVAAGEDRIPGALENVVAAGASYLPVGDGPFGAVRLRHIGAYPLVEDDSEHADASSLLDVELGYRLGGARLSLSLLNALDEQSSDIQYYYESRLAGEPAAGVADLHFHPAEPRQLRVSVSWGM
jgi:outer membrane receptor protein involved in Fe transport